MTTIQTELYPHSDGDVCRPCFPKTGPNHFFNLLALCHSHPQQKILSAMHTRFPCTFYSITRQRCHYGSIIRTFFLNSPIPLAFGWQLMTIIVENPGLHYIAMPRWRLLRRTSHARSAKHLPNHLRCVTDG